MKPRKIRRLRSVNGDSTRTTQAKERTKALRAARQMKFAVARG